MSRNQSDDSRARGNGSGKNAGEPNLRQAARKVEAAKNPMGNGQGDAQADDPKHEMTASQAAGKDSRSDGEKRRR